MPRPLRDQSAGVRHVTCRGNRRQPIFTDDFDRERFLVLLGKVSRRFGWRCLAYCLMTNHVHLVLDVPADTLSRGMQLLNGQYAQAYNRRYGYVGHLFQGRFHSVRVDDEAYSLQLMRYVVLNPPRAGMVERAVDWSWSSHRAMLGKVAPPAYLDVGWALRRFGHTVADARRAYAAFVDAAAPRGEAEQRYGAAPRGQTPGRAPPGHDR